MCVLRFLNQKQPYAAVAGNMHPLHDFTKLTALGCKMWRRKENTVLGKHDKMANFIPPVMKPKKYIFLSKNVEIKTNKASWVLRLD